MSDPAPVNAQELAQAMAAYADALDAYARAAHVYGTMLMSLAPGTRVLTLPTGPPPSKPDTHGAIGVMGGLTCVDCGAFLEHACPSLPAEVPA